MLAVLCVGLAAVHQSFGAVWIPPGTVLSALAAPSDGFLETVVLRQRLPRLEVAAFAGAALAVAGFALQKVLRNPLVSPSTLGISGGAALAVVAGQFFLALRGGSLLLPATAGAGTALMATLALSRLIAGQGDPRLDLVLAGSMVSMLCGALTTFLVSLDPQAFDGLMRWLVGDIGLQDSRALPLTAGPAAAAAAGLLALSRTTDLLAAGDDTARALGLAAGAVTWMTVALAVVLAVAAVATVGPIGFLGLVVPHMARLLLGEAGPAPLAGCLLLGPAMLILADILARCLMAPQVMITGTVMGLIGGAAFLALLLRLGRRGLE
nr:iron ABC transporter permease [Mangrovicoccus algicola]